MQKFLTCLLPLICGFMGSGQSALATTYFVSPSGNDSYDGTSVQTAWQSINRVNQAVLQPGDKVLFEGAQTFSGTIDANERGTPEKPIVYSSYGKETAIISSGIQQGFIAFNTDAIEIRRLKFMGAGRDSNQAAGVFFYREENTPTTTPFRHILIDSLEVSGYQSYGIVVGSHSAAVSFWGFAYGYDDVRITNTITHDNGDTGIFSYGATLHAHHNWYVANCKSYNNSGLYSVTDRNTGSGIVLANVDSGVIEECEAYNNGWLSKHSYTGPAGIWAYACNDLIIQKCESHHNHSGTIDGGGFDLDGGCTNSMLQYNYSHDNDGPGLMLAQYNGAPVAMENLTIRYNISENDARKYGSSILLWSSGAGGGIRGANIYHNSVYLAPSTSYSPVAVYVASPSITETALRNNVFQTTGGVPMLLDQGGGVTFQGNCYWGSGSPTSWRQWSSTFSSLEEWRANTGAERLNGANSGLYTDPKFISPGVGGTNPWGVGSSLSSWKPYQLQATSPLLGAGLDLQTLFGLTLGAHDLYGFALPPAGAPVNIGAQGGGASNPLPVELIRFQAKPAANKVLVQWATALELNSAFFEIQRSTDGKTFVSVAKVAAAGQSSTVRAYTWNDTYNVTQPTYYRLRQVDLDGSSHYSSVVVVAPTTASELALSLFPNPARRGSKLLLDAASWAGQPLRVTITNLTGQVVLQQQVVASRTTPVAVPLPAQVSSGSYVVSVTSGNQVFRTRLVIE
ncbi:right-handed parallel beta-helix repeat-containing protein [Hymenobacter fodinae]|uniref:Right-handed parallel beta-helix repeat-containing protein n=1 Tax=Hymenobacter fodinae TaxID=2510796 RepID=A0A4Z0P940_9BACT|nr:right-handed parallel beta-helix repeat-containing protein [Hymenobacter fodinae]TGE08500.1 right-handed parallel beta-helix repeat-containing protein [Hymenobacter fodinae]